MKRSFSKIIALVLCAVMLFSTAAFASMDTDNITASYVEFSRSEAGTEITARAMLHNDGDDAENAKLIIVAYNGTNVEMAGASETVTIASGEEEYVSATISFDNSCTYKAFLWTAGNNTPLAEVANANAEAEIKGIEINGVAIDNFSTDTASYDYVVDFDNPALPVVKGITADNAVYATTEYSIADDKQSAIAAIKVYNLYGSANVQKTYTVNISIAPIPADYQIVDLNGATLSDDTTTSYGYAADGTILRNKVSSAAVASEYATGGNGKLYTNLNGITDKDNPALYGSRWLETLTPSDNRRLIFQVAPEFKDNSYFVFDATTTAGEGNLLKFKVTMPCRVSIIAQATGLSFDGFSEEYLNDAVIAWQAYYASSGNKGNYAMICAVDENDPYVTPSTDVAFGMIWDMTPYNSKRLSWDEYYAKWFEGKTETSSANLKTSIESLFAFKNNSAGVEDFNAGLNTDGAGYFKNSYDYVYSKVFEAGDVVIPGEANGTKLDSPLVVISPINEINYDIVDLKGATLSDDTTTSYGYAADGTVLRNKVSSAAVASEYASGSGKLYTNLNGIEDKDDAALYGSRWFENVTPLGNRRFIFHVDPKFKDNQYFIFSGSVAPAEGSNILKFNVKEPCTVSIITTKSGLSFDGFSYEFVDDAIMPWQAYYSSSGNTGNYAWICAIDENDPYVTPSTDVAFGMIWDMTPYNSKRLSWDEYYAKWFEGKTETSSANLKTSIERLFAFQNNSAGVEDFNAGLNSDGAGYFKNGYDNVYSKSFAAGEVVIPREANGKSMAEAIVVISPVVRSWQQITEHTSDAEVGADNIADDINEKLWYTEMVK